MDFNKCIFVGKVNGTPTISENNGQKQATFNFTVNDRTQSTDGQWVNRPMDILVYTQSSKQAGVIEQYVNPGHELLIECQYVSWKDSNGSPKHAFRLLSIILGYSPKQDNQPKQQGSGGFPM